MSTGTHSPESTSLHSPESTGTHSPESTGTHSPVSTGSHSRESTSPHSLVSTGIHSPVPAAGVAARVQFSHELCSGIRCPALPRNPYLVSSSRTPSRTGASRLLAIPPAGRLPPGFVQVSRMPLPRGEIPHCQSGGWLSGLQLLCLAAPYPGGAVVWRIFLRLGLSRHLL